MNKLHGVDVRDELKLREHRALRAEADRHRIRGYVILQSLDRGGLNLVPPVGRDVVLLRVGGHDVHLRVGVNARRELGLVEG